MQSLHELFLSKREIKHTTFRRCPADNARKFCMIYFFYFKNRMTRVTTAFLLSLQTSHICFPFFMKFMKNKLYSKTSLS